MIFPLNTTVAFIDMDVAGISGSSYGKSKKWKSFDLINAGTDKIRFVQKEGHADDAGNLLICNGKEVNPVYFVEEIIDGYLLDICNTKIYDGGGNILFFLSLWKCTQNQKWLDIAKKGLNGFEELGLIKDIKDISLFVGTVGTLYILYWLYSFTGENEYLEKLEGHAEKVLEKLPELQMKVDLVSGLSGAVTALVRINKNVHVKAIDEILDVIGNKLFNMVENDELPFMTGFAHGYAGISLALAEYGAHISNKRFIESEGEICKLFMNNS